MIGNILKGITGIAGKFTDTIKHKNEIKLKVQESQHNYLKEKVSIGLFTFVAITVVLPYFFYVLSPILKYIPLMTEVLNDYEKILSTITIDRIFHVIFTLLGLGGLSAGAFTIGKIKMAAKKADNDAAIKKEEIKRGIIGDSFVKITTKSKLKKVQEFVKKFGPMAEKVEEKYDLPASGVLAHAALESGWGKSILKGYKIPGDEKIETNNIFNIKKSSTWTGDIATRKVWEVKNGEDVNETHAFKVYRSIQSAFNDYAELLTTKERYKPVMGTLNAEEYGKALSECGYATDPKFPEKIEKIADKYFIYET